MKKLIFKMYSKIKEFYLKKEQEKMGVKFIEIMEVIYAIILACGVTKIIQTFPKGIIGLPNVQRSSIIISILVLIRFFFAPSKNIKILGEKAKGWKWSIMPIDVSFLIAHSFIYYYMCSNIDKFEIFYLYFFRLLFVNSVWLFFIWVRLRKENIPYIKIWSISNLIFFILYLGLKNVNCWMIFFLLALLNCIIDLSTTYSDYFKD